MKRIGSLLAVILLLGLPWLVMSPYVIHLLIMAGIFVILATSLNLTLGYLGLLSLGHAAFYGLGAYASALAYLRLGTPFPLSMAIAILTTAAVGYVLGAITLRLRGAYFVIVTIGLGAISRLVALNWINLTRGPMGLLGVNQPRIKMPGLPELNLGEKSLYYYLILLGAVVSVYVSARLVNSSVGRACIGLRENEKLAMAVGIDAYRYSMIAFVLSTAMAGLAGSLYVHYVTYISPEIFSFSNSVTMAVMVIAGGAGTVAGPVFGALVFTFIPEFLRGIADYRMMIYGAVLVLVIIFMPRGILPSLIQGYSRLSRGREFKLGTYTGK